MARLQIRFGLAFVPDIAQSHNDFFHVDVFDKVDARGLDVFGCDGRVTLDRGKYGVYLFGVLEDDLLLASDQEGVGGHLQVAHVGYGVQHLVGAVDIHAEAVYLLELYVALDVEGDVHACLGRELVAQHVHRAVDDLFIADLSQSLAVVAVFVGRQRTHEDRRGCGDRNEYHENSEQGPLAPRDPVIEVPEPVAYEEQQAEGVIAYGYEYIAYKQYTIDQVAAEIKEWSSQS